MNNPALLFLFALSLAASFLFSGMEAGVLALNRLRIRQLMKKGNRRALLLHGFLEQPEQFLWTILIGNTLANLVNVGLIVVFLKQRLAPEEGREAAHPALFWLVFAGVVFLLLYGLCDLLPKMMFRLFPTRLCLAMAVPFRFANESLAPLVALVTWLAQGLVRWSGEKRFTGKLFGTRDELRLFVQESSQNLTSEERAMINRVLDLQKRTVGQIAIPLEKAVTVAASASMRGVMALSQEKGVTRLPVWQGEGAARRISGILSLRSALYRPDFNPDLRAENYLRPALYFDEDTRLETALERLQRAGERVAIVLDRNRREIGLVSLQDLLQTVFGDVHL
jgi:putative hemolysin